MSFKDRLRDRIQLELGIKFELMPPSRDPYRKWFFDPSFNLVWFGKKLQNPRVELPSFGQGYVKIVEVGRDPNSNLIIHEFISRCFWLGLAIRILGFDFGFGIFYRKEYKWKTKNISKIIL